MSDVTDPTTRFWSLAEPFLARAGVEEGRILSFPCLRVDGDFFATAEHRTGELVVKLPSSRVDELVGTGEGRPFGPGGRTFKEWVLVPEGSDERWAALMEEAMAFVGGDR